MYTPTANQKVSVFIVVIGDVVNTDRDDVYSYK